MFVKTKSEISNQNPDYTIKNKGFAVMIGIITGFINGVFGGGGGMIVVPLLILLLKYEVKVSHATAILIILPISVVSGLFYTIFGNLDLKLTFPVLIGEIVGGISGALLLKKINNRHLIIIFSLVMAIAGIKMLFF